MRFEGSLGDEEGSMGLEVMDYGYTYDMLIFNKQ